MDNISYYIYVEKHSMNLYIIQNDTHYKNFVFLASEGDFFINISRFTGQHINYNSLYEKNVIEIDLSLNDESFYLLNPFQKISFCNIFKKEIKNKFKNKKINKIIIGNDGALQKIIIECVSKNNKEIVVDMWLDGLISLRNSRLMNSIKLFTSYVAEKIRFSYFFPSVIGTYGRIDSLFVMDDSVINEFNCLLIKSKIKRIEKVVFPRHKELMLMASVSHSDSVKYRVLYLTSAWAFHGHNKWQQHQFQQVEKLIAYFKNKKNIDFKVRVHPRDLKNNYNKLDCRIFSESPSFEEDIINSDFIISARSTGLFEAEMIGKKAIIYDEYFEGNFMNGFLRTLPKFTNVQDLGNEIDVKEY